MKYTNLARKYGWKNATNEYLPKWVLPLITLIGLTIIIILSLGYGLTLKEKSDCLKWKDYENNYPKFVASKGIKEQCGQFQIYFK